MIIPSLYRGAMHVAAAVAPRVLRGTGKAARAVQGQRRAHERIVRWAELHRRADLPLVWFHAPSVGEGLQARAVIEVLRARRPELQILYTFFSPSAERLAASLPVDYADFLPVDLPAVSRRVLDAVRPDAVVFTKTEIWPTLVSEAKQRGIPAALLSATLPPGAGRLRWPGRLLLRPAHRLLEHVGAIAPDDARRFESLGVPPARTSVTGDARFDQVAARAAAPGANNDLVERVRADGRFVLVAGSTWPADEARVVPAAARLRAAGLRIRLVIVPHEPTEAHLAPLLARGRAHRMQSALLSELAPGAAVPDMLVVDRVGILGELYHAADAAFVGGAFGRDGIHSVLEPAAYGAPVVFGPFHRNAREAAELLEAGAARVVASAEDLRAVLLGWTRDPRSRRASGARARAYVEEHLGAASRGADLVERLLEGGPTGRAPAG